MERKAWIIQNIEEYVRNLEIAESRAKDADLFGFTKPFNKFKIFSDFYLPISLVKITNKEIKEEQKNYNVEQAKDLGIEQLQEELDNEIEDKSKVVNKIINTYEKEDGIEVYVTYEVLEDIGTNEKIVF